MKYTRLVRNEIYLRVTIIEWIMAKQPDTYKKLKSIYPGISRIVSDERNFKDTKRLMEEKRGVEI